MSRRILRYGAPLTVVVLLVFAWVVYRRVADGGPQAVVVLAIAAALVWVVGTGVFIVTWPRITVRGYRRAIMRGALGDGPVPANVLTVAPPRTAQTGAPGGLLSTGSDDLLYLGGWLDVRSGPQLLHVPDMGARYYSLQLTDPASGVDFAYVGTRATGSRAGDFFLASPGWTGTQPQGTVRIDVPHGVALVLGRVFAHGDDDVRAAYALVQPMGLTRP